MRIAPLLLSVYQNQPCSILKVAHHGSANFYQELYQELHFDLAMISVGAGNGYGHPTRRALDTLAQSGIPVARTDRNGWLAARCESSTPNGGKTLTVTAQR
jgi:competence protein ComEC